jgi:hypothetical protein
MPDVTCHKIRPAARLQRDGDLADLVDQHGFDGSYQSVKRFVRRLHLAQQPSRTRGS